MLKAMSSLAARQIVIFLIALALVLPRVCIAYALPERSTHGTTDHLAESVHCAHHDNPSAGHRGNSGIQDCCDQCTCCAAPALAAPQVTPVKLRISLGVAPYAIKGTAQRTELAKTILKINSHGPPPPLLKH
jgi:hypothetical protein